jgi:hypothetical protein
MKKLLIAVALMLGFAVCAHAEDATKAAKQVTTELQNTGVITAQEFSSVNASVKTLIENGATAAEAKSTVAQAVRQAKAQGLKGKALSAKVDEAVKAKKAQMDEAKKKAKEAEAKAKKEAEAKKKDLQKRTNKYR